MQQNAEGLGFGINLIEREARESDSGDIEGFLPDEFKEREYEILGEGESNFAVLSKPLKENIHTKSEHFPDTEMEELRTSFLITGVNKETGKAEEFLLVFEQLKNGSAVFTDPRPLETWNEILEKKDSKERDKCLYKTNNGHSFLSFGEWIVKHQDKYKVSGVGLSNPKPIYLKNVNQEEYSKILRANEVKKTT